MKGCGNEGVRDREENVDGERCAGTKVCVVKSVQGRKYAWSKVCKDEKVRGWKYICMDKSVCVVKSIKLFEDKSVW